MTIYTGKVRLFVCKIAEGEYDVGGQCASFDDGLISDVSDNQWGDILETELSNSGWDLFEDDVRDVIDHYQVDDVIEIVGDTRLEYTTTGGYFDVAEVDLDASLVNIRHRKLTQEQVERLAFDFIEKDIPI